MIQSDATAPGLRRRIEIHPLPGVVSAGLEDDLHRFMMRLTHADGVVTNLEARAERYPWSTCPEAGAFLTEQAVGQSLKTLAALDVYRHCTHLFELAILCAAHAADPKPIRFDLWVADRENNRTRATLSENGEQVLSWALDGTMIEAPEAWAGRDLRKLSSWRTELSPAMAEHAMLMRRAVHISGGRNPVPRLARAADRGPSRMGACFTYQMPRALESFPNPDWRRDFHALGVDPLQQFDPHWS